MGGPLDGCGVSALLAAMETTALISAQRSRRGVVGSALAIASAASPRGTFGVDLDCLER